MSNRMIRDNLVERIWEGTVRNLHRSIFPELKLVCARSWFCLWTLCELLRTRLQFLRI